MAKVIAVTRGSTGQTHCAYLVHPDKFNYDPEGNVLSVKLSELPVEANINNGQGIGFYLSKGFIDPRQFVQFAEYKAFKKKYPKQAEVFEEAALEDEAVAEAREVQTLAEKAQGITADQLRDLETNPEGGSGLHGVTTT